MPPKSGRVCFVFLGLDMGILVSAPTLSVLGLTPEGEMVCPWKSASVVPSLALEGENLGCAFEGV